MQQQISVITLGIADLERSKQFYSDGFGWKPIFENEEIAFYQMNGFVFGTWLGSELAKDTQRDSLNSPAAFSLAHNVSSREDVELTMQRLVDAGGKLLRPADEPPQGGFRGYVADPDDHAWEIAYNPTWPIDENGHVTFAA
ncbi:VOC family protein [Limibacillus halophilus]|uniref:VOC domain-containing protein n=1 Tax=Limibacillus halophilus TaxID=1579333 RepID=A0A839SPU7_9PROT|nr:VOC family protein [Limibacillus halophilus]MBB3063959.1 hypothetical protein [Limibacillus halophilus]